jgi:hypothetical protein
MNECHGLCDSLNNILFEGAPKKKVSAHVNLEYLKFAYMVATANELVYLNSFVNDALSRNIPQAEILGEIQLRLREAWNTLATSRLGYTAFQKMDIETIITAKNPEEIIRKTSIVRSKK